MYFILLEKQGINLKIKYLEAILTSINGRHFFQEEFLLWVLIFAKLFSALPHTLITSNSTFSHIKIRTFESSHRCSGSILTWVHADFEVTFLSILSVVSFSFGIFCATSSCKTWKLGSPRLESYWHTDVSLTLNIDISNVSLTLNIFVYK